ncbi:GIN domain-containing protein [Foetidibacter luteolus]|uniref:GIN domain-containing protein n=1 Tax=Foetidibacter luteolus TaxID=2608880 RepID=UPI00129AFFC4|nr:DUF2807 domain-containing protein [Foetidibacter luteolus]
MKNIFQYSFKPAAGIIITMLLFFTYTASYAGDCKAKKINLEKAFSNVELFGNVTVILTNDGDNSFCVEADPKDAERIKADVANGKLRIDARRTNKDTPATIYLPAVQLESLQVNGNSFITSKGKLNNSDLQILLNGVSKVRVASNAKINIKALDGFEME